MAEATASNGVKRPNEMKEEEGANKRRQVSAILYFTDDQPSFSLPPLSLLYPFPLPSRLRLLSPSAHSQQGR